MIETNARGILLDIEGTTSSISFVYDVMFPYVRTNVASFLAASWDNEDVRACLPVLANDLGFPSREKWLGTAAAIQQQTTVCNGVIELMDADVKATGLKQLQGLVWKSGFHGGQLVAHLFADVAESINDWHQAGIDIRIYSSGSVAAQKLFFGHTIAGNLLGCFTAHYDTTTGPKKDSNSYKKIATEFGIPASEILFVSDIVDELTAARSAGMQTVLSVRPGNHQVTSDHGFDVVRSFAELQTNTKNC